MKYLLAGIILEMSEPTMIAIIVWVMRRMVEALPN